MGILPAFLCVHIEERRLGTRQIRNVSVAEIVPRRELLRALCPNYPSRVTWPAVGTVQLLWLVCLGLALPRVLPIVFALIQTPSEAYPTVIWTIVVLRDSMYFVRLVLQEMNPFCLSANDMDMVLLVSRPGPPPLDVSKGICNTPFLPCAFTSFMVRCSIWEP